MLIGFSNLFDVNPFLFLDKVSDQDSIMSLFSTKVGEDNFILFSGELTWLEAVIQCRQRGLQIAEVTTMNQAQSLATGMLRVRPSNRFNNFFL